MKKYEVNYDLVTAVDNGGQRKVIDVASKKATINEAADDLDVQAEIAAKEGIGADLIVITSCSSSDVVPN